MRVVVLSAVAMLGVGCAAPLPLATDAPPPQFPDHAYGSRPALPSRDDVFALDEPMQQYAVELRRRMHGRTAEAGLFEALRGDLRIEYDAALTRTAAQAFAARSGNCLSLVILTAAFARHLGVPVQYQRIYGLDSWARSSGIAFLSGHVNLVLGNRRPAIWNSDGDAARVVDFLPPQNTVRLSSRLVDERTVVAMYYNNRAAETLAAGDAATAYWWARAALEAEPTFLSAWNTLGVIHLRHGDLEEAGRALEWALAREPGNTGTLSNLVTVMVRQGRAAEARALQEQLGGLMEQPPFWYLDQGVAALERGDYETARSLLNKELRRMPYDDEVHFAIAVADLKLGHTRRARKHVALAIEHSSTRQRRDIYAAKLAYLQTLPSR